MNKKQYVLNCDMFEMQGPNFEMLQFHLLSYYVHCVTKCD